MSEGFSYRNVPVLREFEDDLSAKGQGNVIHTLCAYHEERVLSEIFRQSSEHVHILTRRFGLAGNSRNIYGHPDFIAAFADAVRNDVDIDIVVTAIPEKYRLGLQSEARLTEEKLDVLGHPAIARVVSALNLRVRWKNFVESPRISVSTTPDTEPLFVVADGKHYKYRVDGEVEVYEREEGEYLRLISESQFDSSRAADLEESFQKVRSSSQVLFQLT